MAKQVLLHSVAEIVLRGTLGDLKAMNKGEASQSPPWTSKEEAEKVKASVDADIAKLEAVLAGGPAAITDWWEAIPAETREGLANA